jgi:hypothetical protein
MKLKELSGILYSTRNCVQFAIIYDHNTNTDIENGCTIDFAIREHGDKEVKQIQAFVNQLLITV